MEQANTTQKIQAIKIYLKISVMPFYVKKLMMLELKHTEILNSMSTMLIKLN